MTVELRRTLSSPALGVMTFLNEVVQRFPNAISFAPGRPSDAFLSAETAMTGVGRWVDHRARVTGRDRAEVLRELGQYGNTAGLIQDLIARHLAVDLNIHVDESSIVVTTGCQEAMLIAALALLDPATDTLLVSDPSYIGMTGVAELTGVPIHPVPSGSDGLRAERVIEAIEAVRRSGRRPRALYDVPDFNNPLGTCMPVAARHELLAVVERHGLLIFEDNPYGAFAYDHEALPTLKSLDRARTVVYLGSFAKTLFPGVRIGYLVADQDTVLGERRGRLASALTTVKSLTTVNTSPITQAMVGGALLQHDASLAPGVQARVPHYRANRDRMLEALAREIDGAAVQGVEWNRPAGGFFLVVTLPFAFGAEQLERCAKEFGVIVVPMTYFALSVGRERQVRLSFSYVDGKAIDEGIARFAQFVRDELQCTPVRVSRAHVGEDTSHALPTESAATLSAIVTRALARRGLSRDDAAFVAEALVETSLRGVDTHGLRLLPTYLKELEGGRARATPAARWYSFVPAVRVLDADGALGLVAGRLAVDEIIQLARQHGVGAVSVRNSNHFGPASAYTLAMARAGLIGIACSNSDALVASFGGARPALGTNPLSMAVLAGTGDMFCADFATSQVAYSRVKAYRTRGWAVPSDWVVSDASLDSQVVLKPLGGYKGQCLGMMVELLSSVLSGSPPGQELSHFYSEPFSEPRGVSHFFLALDPAAFGDAAAFRERVAAFLAFVRSEDTTQSAAVLTPGDPEAASRAARTRDGIPLAEPELSCIRALLEEERSVAVVA